MSNIRIAVAIAALIMFSFATTSATAAESETKASAIIVQPKKKLTLSVSPFHLLLPVAEVTGEYAVSQRFGIAGIAGVGGANGFYVITVGGQGAYYVSGDFEEGVQLGAEAIYTELGGSSNGHSVALLGGLGLSPFIGYKTSARSGLTAVAQVGPQLAVASSQYGSAAGLGIMLNLNFGWTF